MHNFYREMSLAIVWLNQDYFNQNLVYYNSFHFIRDSRRQKMLQTYCYLLRKLLYELHYLTNCCGCSLRSGELNWSKVLVDRSKVG